MNNNFRAFLWAICAASFMILWVQWQGANAPAAQETPQNTAQTADGQSAEIPNAPTTPASDINTQATASQVPGETIPLAHSGELIHVETDVLSIQIDTRGGTLVESDLLQYPISVNDDTPIKLFQATPGQVFTLETGLNSNFESNATHQAIFTSQATSYRLTGDTLVVPLVWEKDGIRVTKTYTFTRGDYHFDIEQRVENTSGQTWQGFQYGQLARNEVVVKRGITTFNTFAGMATSSPERAYNKISFGEVADEPLEIKDVTGGWAAMIEHYFMGAIIPNQDSEHQFFAKQFANNLYRIGMIGQPTVVEDGQNHVFTQQGFVGPKIKDDLKSIAPHLDKATDYGPLFFLSEWLFNLLNWVHAVVGNWGWAIVIVTILIKLVLFPLAAKSFKSMAKMRKFQPQLERIRDNYKEDRQRLGQEMMKLYKKEGINPASGCFPILIQIPIFLAFFYMLMESVELRQAPWIFWIEDLSIKDPWYVLPVINTVLMYLQQKLNPPPADPMQRKIMNMLPVLFGIFFLFFPSGLVLYWTVSNLFSIVQQYVITKKYGALTLKHAE